MEKIEDEIIILDSEADEIIVETLDQTQDEEDEIDITTPSIHIVDNDKKKKQ